MGLSSRLWVENGSGAHAVVPKRQQARKTVVPADAQCSRLRIGEPSLGYQISKKACSPPALYIGSLCRGSV
jgi:hypothetical protein